MMRGASLSTKPERLWRELDLNQRSQGYEPDEQAYARTKG